MLDMALLSHIPYHGLPANHSTRLEGRVNDRQSGKDCTTVGRTQGGGAVQSRIGAIAGDISPDATNSLRGPDPAHRFRLVVCRRRWRHRVPHRFPRNGTSARCLANPGQSASIYATRRGGRRLSQSSGQETKETTRRVGTTPTVASKGRPPARGVSRRFWRLYLRIQKFRSWRPKFGRRS